VINPLTTNARCRSTSGENKRVLTGKSFVRRSIEISKKLNRLEQALTDAAERTYGEMTQLQKIGYREHEAWEVVRETYLFMPEEGKRLSHSDSPFWKDRM
jgi:hypothetical protein